MFESAEIGRQLDDDAYEERVPKLRTEMIRLQYELRGGDFPVIVVIAGDDRPACDDIVNLLNEWFDPRFLNTSAFGPPSDEERERPWFWRYWRTLPPRGEVGIFAGGWGLQLIGRRLRGEIKEAHWLRWIEHLRRFERMLVDDGAVIVKFWLHTSKQQLKQRLKLAEKHPDRFWRISDEDWQIYKNFDSGLDIVETFLRKTSRGHAPWHIVESTDATYLNVTVAETVVAEIQRQLADRRPEDKARATSSSDDAPVAPTDPHTVLDTLDLSQQLSKKEYREELDHWQARLNRLAREAHQCGASAVLVFEGWDAGGKGGAIRRLTKAMHAQMYRVVPIAAPSEEEHRYHYLWRFWRHLQRAGRVLIFDRSWYGRVLVERVEGFATEAQWRRAYSEIVDFEEQLSGHGIFLGKFWLHISAEEQLQRFKRREETPYKQFKITADDYRNREKWHDYEAAAGEMVARTSTSFAPWHLIPANDKCYARIEVIKRVCQGLERAVEEAK